LAGGALGAAAALVAAPPLVEAAGLLVRETPPDNRRVVRARLTRGGQDALRRAQAAFATGVAEAFATHLSDTEVKSLRRTLRKLLERNGAWSEDRCLIALAEVGSEHAG